MSIFRVVYFLLYFSEGSKSKHSFTASVFQIFDAFFLLFQAAVRLNSLLYDMKISQMFLEL